jgi:hypothetical protein
VEETTAAEQTPPQSLARTQVRTAEISKYRTIAMDFELPGARAIERLKADLSRQAWGM